ncbi:hypothetical protein C8J57DRAFT_1337988 [Mycena rebaudengoi]|nr:hypothetical protein C8J57DRAFT_1337988 [Mycena rebaudengoi]
MRPTFPAMRLATCLSPLQCTPLQLSSHLFHNKITLPLSTLRCTNTAEDASGGACHCPVMVHAQLYFTRQTRRRASHRECFMPLFFYPSSLSPGSLFDAPIRLVIA